MKESLDYWNANEVIKLFGIKSKTALLNAEKAGRIPEAERDEKNNRRWRKEDLPKIGCVYGPIERPKDFEFVSMCVFTVKGGVLKTTTSYVIARILALCGFRVLIVGNDPQGSITGVTMNPLNKHKSLDDLPKYKDIADVLFEDVPLLDAVQKTDLPTLDLLPETKSLGSISETVAATAAVAVTQGKEEQILPRHTYYSEFLNPLIKQAGYDFAIYDNGPGLNPLSENSLYASDYWITPNSCDQGSYQVFEDNFNDVLSFAKRKGKKWKRIFLVPTILENNNLSKQIHGTFLTKFPAYVTATSIRRTVRAQEALSMGASPTEVFLDSDIGHDCMALALEIWNVIQQDQKGVSNGH